MPNSPPSFETPPLSRNTLLSANATQTPSAQRNPAGRAKKVMLRLKDRDTLLWSSRRALGAKKWRKISLREVTGIQASKQRTAEGVAGSFMCAMRLVDPLALFSSLPSSSYICQAVNVCVCVCVFIKLHITTQSGPVILVILCHSH